jgi:hypothetical protein
MAKGSLPHETNLFQTLVAKSIPPEDEPYFAALGKFIASYAMAEHGIHLLARALTRLSDAKARIIFSGMRLGDLTDRIRGLLRASKASEKRCREVDACLVQLGLIADQRNKIVHRFISYSAGAIVVTNFVIAKSTMALEFDRFSISDFGNMESDCVAISLRIGVVADARHRKSAKPDLIKWAGLPWRYKPRRPSATSRPARPKCTPTPT